MILVIFMLTGCGTKPKADNAVAQPTDDNTATAQNVKEINYVGAISENLEIHMRLKFQDEKISGNYYYGTVRVDLPLTGIIDKTRKIELIEYDANGKPTGTFKGIFVADDRIEGVWSNDKLKYFNKSKTLYPFYLVQETQNENLKRSRPLDKNKSVWEGEWNKDKSSRFANAGIDIKFATDKSFWFDLNVFNAGNSGRISGMALIKEDSAIFDDGNGGKITFAPQSGKLQVTATKEVAGYSGLGVDFGGVYAKGELEALRRTFKEMGVFHNDTQEQKFKDMVGNYYDQFIASFQLSDHVLEDEAGVKVSIGYVRGLRSYMGGIIMVAPDDTMWAAVISGDKVIYFTNYHQSVEPPETIRYWKPRDKEMVLFSKGLAE